MPSAPAWIDLAPVDMSAQWKDFFQTYRNASVATEADLFFQVGRTVNRIPTSEEVFRKLVARIIARLRLSPQDHLFEYCCGNGLVTFELAAAVRKVTAIDFTEHYVQTARRLKGRDNIAYQVADAAAPLQGLVSRRDLPNKFFMASALAYFSPPELEEILRNLLRLVGKNPFQFFITEIPNARLKWNFYNTPERVARHLENEERSPGTNDGVGRWWRAEEIQDICAGLKVNVKIQNMPPQFYNYRMEALVSPGRGEEQ